MGRCRCDLAESAVRGRGAARRRAVGLLQREEVAIGLPLAAAGLGVSDEPWHGRWLERFSAFIGRLALGNPEVAA